MLSLIKIDTTNKQNINLKQTSTEQKITKTIFENWNKKNKIFCQKPSFEYKTFSCIYFE